jgi:glycosyltransferase involved in cell wall biosynthesis
MNIQNTIDSIKTDGATINYDLICLSHLRWDFVYQRPQHLLSRFAKSGRVFFFEEPIFSDKPSRLEISRREDNLTVVVPHISDFDREVFQDVETQRELLDQLIAQENIKDFVLWFYTPMALDFADHLKPLATVFDCMDELSAFKFAPPELLENERRLLEKADLVFTGGQSLYEAKKGKHPQVFAFPSSIDTAHFNQAREVSAEPPEQQNIPHPRIGYCGVIDERIDLELLANTAELRPDWQFIMIGPVVKISENDLPRRENIHYLGGKDYKDLPKFMAGWDVAMMPFALNESTRYISPTKTPEYLAAGLPVISTAIRDVVRPYHEKGLVYIVGSSEDFSSAVTKALQEHSTAKVSKADEFLADNSWDKTWAEMKRLIDATVAGETKVAAQKV